jgi:hypothetical protein
VWSRLRAPPPALPRVLGSWNLPGPPPFPDAPDGSAPILFYYVYLHYLIPFPQLYKEYVFTRPRRPGPTPAPALAGFPAGGHMPSPRPPVGPRRQKVRAAGEVGKETWQRAAKSQRPERTWESPSKRFLYYSSYTIPIIKNT